MGAPLLITVSEGHEGRLTEAFPRDVFSRPYASQGGKIFAFRRMPVRRPLGERICATNSGCSETQLFMCSPVSAQMVFFFSGRFALGGHPKPANDGHLKTGQR